MSADTVDHTHSPSLRSWVGSANLPGAAFPIQNLPLGVYRPPGGEARPRGGVAIGDRILDVAACADLLGDDARPGAAAMAEPSLNRLAALPPEAWTALRHGLSRALAAGSDLRSALEPHLSAAGACAMALPVRPGGFVDFFASLHHATNAGGLFRPDAPLLPNYKYVPIGYHGRTSTLRPSGTPVPRPNGQVRPAADAPPVYAASRRLDYEMELGICLGGSSPPGRPVGMREAWRHVFGVFLLNDWSARDVQAWEYQPLGPFTGKSFATSVSPWIVTADALAPFRVPPPPRPAGDPAPLPYLSSEEDARCGALAIHLDAFLRTGPMAERGEAPLRLGGACAATLYWTVAQMIAHQTCSGANIEPGDIYGSGTISGPTPGSLGSLLEITRGGSSPLSLPDGSRRTFLEDGDEITLSGRCERDGFVPIGLGECRGRIEPALPST